MNTIESIEHELAGVRAKRDAARHSLGRVRLDHPYASQGYPEGKLQRAISDADAREQTLVEQLASLRNDAARRRQSSEDDEFRRLSRGQWAKMICRTDAELLSIRTPLGPLASSFGTYADQILDALGAPSDPLAERLAGLFTSAFNRGFDEEGLTAAWPRLASISEAPRGASAATGGMSAAALPAVVEGDDLSVVTALKESAPSDISWSGCSIEMTHARAYSMTLQDIALMFERSGRMVQETIDRALVAAIEGADFSNAATVRALTAAGIAGAIGDHRGLTLPDGSNYQSARVAVLSPEAVPSARAYFYRGNNDGGPESVASGITLGTWYLACNPSFAAAFTLVRPPGLERPILRPQVGRGGPMAAWSVYLPMRIATVYAGAGKPLGWHKFTVA
jgi:hypothetical protein